MVCSRVCASAAIVVVLLAVALPLASASGCKGEHVTWNYKVKPATATIPDACGDLYLHNAMIRDVGFRAITGMVAAEGAKLKIAMLDLSYNKLSDAPLADFLVAMEKNTAIQDLGLNHNKLTSKGAILIGKALPKLNIQKAFLGGNHFNDEGVIAIAKGIAGFKGRVFALQDCEMTGVGLKALAEAAKDHQSLQDFVAPSNPKIGGAAIADVITILASGTNKIQKIILSDCGCDEAAGAAILKAVTGSRIQHLAIGGNMAFQESQVFKDIEAALAVNRDPEHPNHGKKTGHDEM